MKKIIASIIVISLLSSISYVNMGIASEENGNTEYWAVMIGVDMNQYIPFDTNVEYMNNMLLISDHWDGDHITVLTNEEATVANILDALIWLDEMDDEDDISLVYYTAHGGQLDRDMWPWDEDDGHDEFLTTYWTAVNPLAVITDDTFSYFLNNLDSQGVAVIIDACFSGGMNDDSVPHVISESIDVAISRVEFYSDEVILLLQDILVLNDTLSSVMWMEEFSEELGQDGRVIMTSCEEEEVGYVPPFFAEFLMIGLQGYADDVNEEGNNDGVVSAEEAFAYAEPRYRQETSDRCHPVIDDRYIGELQLTDVELPPDSPEWIDGPLVGETNTVYPYQVSSLDPENDDIKYGWIWNAYPTFFRYWKKFLVVDEWIGYYPSGEIVTTTHLWDEPGIYDIRVKSQDEYGAEGILKRDAWSDDCTTIIISDDEIVDQFQTTDKENTNGLERKHTSDTKWCAQSFIPNSDTLSKVTLQVLYNHLEDTDTLFDVSIRDNLTGNNLTEISQGSDTYNSYRWMEFDFPDISVTPSETYYIVVKSSECPGGIIASGLWTTNGETQDSYPMGEGYTSDDAGETWECPSPPNNLDFCFVTYE